MNKKCIRHIENLYAAKTETVLEAIEEIRKDLQPDCLEALLQLLEENKEKVVKDSIVALLNDNKSAEFRSIIAKQISSCKNAEIRKLLIASCWQSGIDYTEYIVLFAESAIHDDFETALEAFTVVEQMAGPFDNELLVNLIDRTKSQAATLKDSRRNLLMELINLFEDRIIQ